MKLKKLAAGLAASLMLTAPLALTPPADAKPAKPAKTPCATITGAKDQTLAPGQAVDIHVRLSEACRKSVIVIDGMFVAPNRRHSLFSASWYRPGRETLTVKVLPIPPSQTNGRVITWSATYTVEAK